MIVINYLRGFKKLVIAIFTSKNTPNLINLFLKNKIKNKVRTVNGQKITYVCYISLLKNLSNTIYKSKSLSCN